MQIMAGDAARFHGLNFHRIQFHRARPPLADNYQTDHPQRLVVIELLSHPRGREREGIYDALRHIDQSEIDRAIASLESEGVLVNAGRLVRPTAALACLERLDLIAI